MTWAKGQSGNPRGRRKGTLGQLARTWRRAVYRDFAKHGEKVLEQVRLSDPATYLKIVAQTVPRPTELPEDLPAGSIFIMQIPQEHLEPPTIELEAERPAETGQSDGDE